MRRLVALILAAFTIIAVASTSAMAGHSLNYHWADADPSYPRGYVYWVDQTGPSWPVYSSAIDWDQETRLDAVYVSSAGACPSHCVSVSEADLDAGCTGRLGVMSPAVNSDGHLNGNTTVQVDRQCSSRNAADRRELVCHELGHSLGLDDRASTAVTCMRQGNMIGRQFPDQHDYDVLHSKYNHND